LRRTIRQLSGGVNINIKAKNELAVAQPFLAVWVSRLQGQT